MLWVTLLPKESDPGGGGTYSAGVRHLLEQEIGGQFDIIPVLPLGGVRRKIKLAASLLMSLFSGQPAKILYCRSRAAIEQVRSSRADVLVCDHVETAYLIPYFSGQSYLILHNVEGALMQRRGELASWATRTFLAREGKRMLTFERWAIDTADVALSLSPDDIAVFADLAPDRPIRHVPPLFSYPPAPPTSLSSPIRLGFVGNLDWWPNQEALHWYLENVHPHHTLHLTVIGAGNAAPFRNAERVDFRGFVPDIRDVWQSFDLMIAPLLSGSGVSIKTAEALYNGKPVLATPVGARGLPARDDGDGVTLCSSAEQWIRVLRDIADGNTPAIPSATTRSAFAI